MDARKMSVKCNGISRDGMHKKRATGGSQKPWRKKRKYDLGQLDSSQKTVGRIRVRVHVRGGNLKWRALRLNTRKFSWGRLETLVKSAIVQVDKEAAAAQETKKSNNVMRKIETRQAERKVDQHVEEQLGSGRLLACISSRPGKELNFYLKKLEKRKGKAACGAF
ncbi:hypothetical protein C2S53_013290 [Perilla frutescens var. hirtella]|uniref:40S ribosomal protein S8 n=1 Tax=Perilla frutescens var. hirtella TaxID=608512 RepID=A0AAD4P5R0_PERFH|nr:hypothetical protein C2S53_013290 [Perilla frutescens var. hirtella]